MIDSRGGVTGGATMSDFLRGYAREGYTGTFVVREHGRIECRTCGRLVPAQDVTVRSMRRVEGVSDPADMSLIGALECPACGARGTATFCHGTHCPPEHGEVLRLLHQDRALQRLAESEDRSLVHDSGWLRGPEGA
jgi:hypothetical protein